MNKSSESNSMLKARTDTHIYPLIWKLFMSSLIFFISTFFLTTWTSTGATWFSIKSLNSTVAKAREFIITPKAIANKPESSNYIDKR
jgi:hypothetical protein